MENKSNIAIVYLKQELHDAQVEMNHAKEKKKRLDEQISNFELQCKQLSEAISDLENKEK